MLKLTVIGVACGYVALTALVYTFQRSLMYFPSRGPLPSPEESGVADMSPVTLRTSDGLSITSWFSVPSGPEGKTVVLFHGNAGTLADRADKARHFLDAGHGVMLVGYRGFSGNPGKPTEPGLYRDARTALQFVKDQGVASRDTVLYGESLGSGIAVQVAYEQAEIVRHDDGVQPYAGIVLEAPFTSMAEAAAVHYPWLPARYLVRDKYASIHKIDLISAPLYVMHGGRDRTVPQGHGKRLYDHAKEPKQAHWMPEAGHVDLYDHGAAGPLVKWLNSLD